MELAREIIADDEPMIIAGLIHDNLKTIWIDGATAKRGQHSKHHGCVKGVFRIVENLPDRLAQGVFQPGREYRCLVRFSNGGRHDDSQPDARGMAIKLLEVEGTKLLPGNGNIKELDFILVDHPTYFAATMPDYVAFNRHFTPIQDVLKNGATLLKLLRAGYSLAVLVLFYRHLLTAARSFAGRRIGSVLAQTYHSTTPYLLGKGQAVKYKAIGKSPDVAATYDQNGLRMDLQDSLAWRTAHFDFGVVVQTDAVKHPVEDPTVNWEAKGAMFIPVAELILDRQDSIERNDVQAETMRFNAWTTLPEHRPLGHINRARRELYAAMSARRKDTSERLQRPPAGAA